MIEHTPLGAIIREATSQLAPDDEQYGDAHAILSEAMSKPFEQIGELLNPIDPYPAWGTLFDVNACPGWALPWLAQLVGVILPSGLSEDEIRYAIDNYMGFKVGTPEAIKATVRQFLGGTQTIYFRERDPSAADPPYSFDVVTLDEETPISDRTLVNLVTNPSSEVSWGFSTKSASTTTPVNIITNPSGEVSTTGWSPRAQNNALLTNLVTNPSGEAGSSTFTFGTASSAGQPASSVVDSTVWAKVGTHCSLYTCTRDDGAQLAFRTNSGVSGYPVTPGHYYAMRVSFKLIALQGGTQLDAILGRIYWYKSDGTAATGTSSTGPGPGIGGIYPGSTGDLWVVGLAPADAAFAAPGLVPNLPTGVVTIQLAADALLLTDLGTTFAGGIDGASTSQYVPAYFDGTMVGCAWTGTAHASTSTRSSFSITDEVPAKFGTRCFRLMRDIDSAGADSIYMVNASGQHPIAEGQYAAVRCVARAKTVGRPWRIRIGFYDGAGVGIGVATNGPDSATQVGDWTDVTHIVGPAPAGSASLSIRIENVGAVVAEGETHYIDGIACYVSATVPSVVPPYVDGDMFGFAWTGTAHSSSSQPAAAAVARTQDWAGAGTWSMRYTATRDDGSQLTIRTDGGTNQGTAGRFAIDPTHYYAFRMKVRIRNTCGPLDDFHLNVVWYASDNSTVVGLATHGTYLYNPTSGVYDIYLIAKPAAGSAYASIRAWFNLASGIVVLDADVDAIAMYDLGVRWTGPVNEQTKEEDVPPYIDGSLPGCTWSGTAHASTSTRPPTTSLIRDALIRAKPGGLVMTYRSVPGYDWQQVPLDHASWTVVVSTYDNWRKLVYNDRS